MDSETTHITWDWTPLVGVGPFKFGSPIANYIERYELTDFHGQVELESELGWYTYEVPGHSAQIHVEDERIVSVSCPESCLLNGFELIGASLSAVTELLGSRPEEMGRALEVEDEPQATAEFPSHELQVWLRADQSIVSVLCSEQFEED